MVGSHLDVWAGTFGQMNLSVLCLQLDTACTRSKSQLQKYIYVKIQRVSNAQPPALHTFYLHQL